MLTNICPVCLSGLRNWLNPEPGQEGFVPMPEEKEDAKPKNAPLGSVDIFNATR
jgi:hypothetical protein